MKLKGTEFVAATGNSGKLREISHILSSIGCRCVPPGELGVTLDDVEETGSTFSENALIKARAAHERTGRAVIADDTGLCVDALDGAPGVHTARYAGEECDPQKNIDKLLHELEGVPREGRSARFVCCVAAITEDGREITAHGCCEGSVAESRDGEGGFGYDPVFRLFNNMTFASMGEARKNAVSHRARALRKLAFKLRGITSVRGIK